LIQEEVIGITGVFEDQQTPDTAILDGSYLTPAYRGQKLSRLFYEARLGWARAQGFRRVTVSHWLSNTASQFANRAFGFQETHRALHAWDDGTEEPEVFYELRL
jgi:GNAT superfamily N-acetyltransferase